MNRIHQNAETLRDEVVRAASAVVDPCSLATPTPRDLGEMGLIHEARVSAEGDVTIDIVLTDPTCWFFADITQAIEKAVQPLPGVRNVIVQQSEKLMWTPDRLKYKSLPIVNVSSGPTEARRDSPEARPERPLTQEQGEEHGL